MRTLCDLILDNIGINNIINEDSSTCISGVFDSLSILIIRAIMNKKNKKNALIITPNYEKAEILYNGLSSISDNTLLMPDMVFEPMLSTDMSELSNITNILMSIRNNQCNILVTSYNNAFYDYPNIIDTENVSINIGEQLDREALINYLSDNGYENVSLTTAMGEFSVRGFVIDIFVIGADYPVRIELWDDEVTGINYFDVESQLSIEDIKGLTIYPCKNTNKLVQLPELFKNDELFIIELDSIIANETKEDNIYNIKNLTNKRSFYSLSELEISSYNNFKHHIKADINTINLNHLDGLLSIIREYRQRNYNIIIMCESEKYCDKLSQILLRENITAVKNNFNELEPNNAPIILSTSFLPQSLVYDNEKIIILSENDVLKKNSYKKSKKRRIGKPLLSSYDLSSGDYVIHEEYGIGRFVEICTMDSDGVKCDYIKIEYDKNSFLYVPISSFDRLQRYAKSDATGIKLNQLGSGKWQRTKSRVKDETVKIAKELLQLYAKRMSKTGYVYSKDTLWQMELESSFEYEETGSQIEAINEIKNDMESTKIMDRLLCGDVGFGKTEVAIRAAFKAVCDGKQVAYLVPTTILASQHYNTFKNRLKNFPVNVDYICRFRTTKEQNDITRRINKGKIDIIIGTHKLLSKDISFKDLGLLIIDEEQRFGVNDKEKLKALKENVDVLTLTATPIPRSLHLGLIGVRDISILNEPPFDRKPIKTYVLKQDDELIKTAINKELDRGGQIYYVHNRVEGIEATTEHIQKLVPKAHTAFIHGQMSPRQIERIMYDFTIGLIDVLIATTIIETGLDIPNVNTMIIEDAQKIGLASLYQLRGRIGRSNNSAYAYLLYKDASIMKDEARKRLTAIKSFVNPGSGYQIATRDLEIRGEGNVFGKEQSGHIASVGYNLYCKMLKNSLLEIRNEKTDNDFDTLIELPINASIPTNYIKDDMLRMSTYKEISLLTNREEMEELQKKLEDRFNRLPKPLINLMQIAIMKVRANKLNISNIKKIGVNLILTIIDVSYLDFNLLTSKLYEFNLNFARMMEPNNERLFNNNSKAYKHSYYGKLRLSENNELIYKLELNEKNKLLEIVAQILSILEISSRQEED